MANNFNTIKSYNNFTKYLIRGNVKSSKQLAAHIFESFFSLTSEPKNGILQITKGMYFKDEVGFDVWRKNLINLKVIEIKDRRKQLHKLGAISMKYLREAYEETNLFPNPLQMMAEIEKLKARQKKLEIEMANDRIWKEQVIKMFPKVVELTLIHGEKK